MNTTSNAEVDADASETPLLMRLLFIGMLAAITVALLEVTLRVATRPFKDLGLQQIVGVPLLPFIADAQRCREAHALASTGKYLVPDDRLGWTIEASGVGGADNYQSNPQGVRTHPDRMFSKMVPDGTYRVVSVGDSFMHADELPFQDTWASHLEGMARNVEVINLGVPGYGTDQALLRWRKDGTQFQSQLAVLGIWPENMCRNLNMNRFYLTQAAYMPKPMFRLDKGNIVSVRERMESIQEIAFALSNPVDTEVYLEDFWRRPYELRDHVYYQSRIIQAAISVYSKYRRKQERKRLYAGTNPVGIDITVAIAKAFHTEVLEHGSHPLILIFPMQNLLDTYPEEDALPLVPALKAQGMEVLNLFPRFSHPADTESDSEYFLPSGHLNRRGNEVVAEQLQRYIATQTGSNLN